MEKLFETTLAGGRKTEVIFSEKKEELCSFLAGAGYIVADGNSAKLIENPSLVLPPGESEKNWKSVDMILSGALGKGLARDSLFAGVGGGVVLDITAFAASIYMRGARIALVPTTLLSMVDATLGGKTGIDYREGKNLVGTFYPAETVFIAPWTLKTLPEKEYISGLGEVVKHAMLSEDDKLFSFMEEERERILERDEGTLSQMIRLSLLVKRWYIERDPEETKGIRSALNLGHTFAHALESFTDYGVSHGEAVAWGTYKAIDTGRRLGITQPDFAERSLKLIDDYGFRTSFDIPDVKRYISLISKDKKKSRGSVKFVLMEGQGRPVLLQLPDDAIEEAVRS